MICNFCKNELTKPIIANNGNMYCDKCLSSMFGTQLMESVELDFGVESTSKYIMSEQLFNESVAIADKDFARANELKKHALELCFESAGKGNPFAMLNIGYYFENGYFDGDRVDLILNALRWQLAIAVYEPEIADIVGVSPYDISSERMLMISELVNTSLYNLQCLLKSNYNFIENSSIKHLFKKEIIEVIGVLQKILIIKGVFTIDENDSASSQVNIDELINNSSIVAAEDPKSVIINLVSNEVENVIYEIRKQSGNLIYKAIFDLKSINKKYTKMFFNKYSLVIRTDEFTIVAKDSKEFDTQYKKRLLEFNGTSILGILSKKDSMNKISFNTVARKKQTFNMSYSSSKCKDYVVNADLSEIIYGKFTLDRLKVIGASIYRNSKVGNSTDYTSDMLQRVSSFIKMK